MSREILFKAKRKNWKELPKEAWWVEGYYVYFEKMKNACMYHIYKGAPLVTDVDSETVCQYTGLTDKNGRKIFEGDIIKTYEANCREYLTNIVKYDEGCFKIFKIHYLSMYLDVYGSEDLEIIGNIFDNPELLEGGTE